MSVVTGASFRIQSSYRANSVPDGAGDLIVASDDILDEIRSVEAPEVSSRKLLARFFNRVEKERNTFSSAVLFVESVLAKAKAQLPPSKEIQLSTAVWALNTLSRDSPVLSDIASHVVPALFDDYSENRCIEGVSMAVKPFLAQSSDFQLAQAPFYSHRFCFEVLASQRASLSEAVAQRSAMKSMGINKLAVARRLVGSHATYSLRMHFLAWRGLKRSSKLEHFSTRIREKRKNQNARRGILGSTFANWRRVVDQNRSIFLQERLHDNTFLLENAKNQFQMQCFRSDRYLHTVEELRSDLQGMRENRDAFRAEARALEKALRDHRIISRDEKNDIANVLLRSLSEWKHTATVSIARRDVPQSLLSLEAAVSDLRIKKGLSGPNTNALTSTLSFVADDGLDEDSRNSSIAERTCLEWVNSVLKNSPLATSSSVSNYGEDFSNGEVLLLLMKEAFPLDVPLTPLQEPNLMRRLDKIGEIASSVGLSHFPQPSDLAEKVPDIVFMAVAEIFMHHTHRLLTTIPTISSAPQCAIRYDAGMVKASLNDLENAMHTLIERESKAADDISRVSNMIVTVSHYAAFLTRERLWGHPVALVDQKEVNRFCRFKQGRFKDLEFKYKAAPMDWTEQLSRLRSVIRKSFPLLKRCFEAYAGGGSSVAEPNFWRFIGDLGVVDKQTPRVAIERIFAVANREDDDIAETYSDEDDADNPITELIPIEFTECVIRIADQRAQGRAIFERVSFFINNSIKPLGARRGDTDKFRREIYDRESQPVWFKYQRDLARVFTHFARHSAVRLPSSPGEKRNKFIGVPDFVAICRDGGATQGSIDENVLTLIARNVIGDDVVEMPLHAFMECLAGLSAFRVPNPFIPLNRKIDHVVSQLLSTLRVRLRGIVPISDVKLVPLQK